MWITSQVLLPSSSLSRGQSEAKAGGVTKSASEEIAVTGEAVDDSLPLSAADPAVDRAVDEDCSDCFDDCPEEFFESVGGTVFCSDFLFTLLIAAWNISIFDAHAGSGQSKMLALTALTGRPLLLVLLLVLLVVVEAVLVLGLLTVSEFPPWVSA